MRETIEGIAREFLETLKGFVTQDAARGPRPADYPHAELEQDELDELVAELSDGNEEGWPA